MLLIILRYKILQSLHFVFSCSDPSRVDALDEDQQTPLIEAAASNSHEILKMLLEYGAKINVVDCNQKTAIFWAAETNSLEALKVLVLLS